MNVGPHHHRRVRNGAQPALDADQPNVRLGQKRTCAAHKLMSALPPKAASNATYGMLPTPFDLLSAKTQIGNNTGRLGRMSALGHSSPESSESATWNIPDCARNVTLAPSCE